MVGRLKKLVFIHDPVFSHVFAMVRCKDQNGFIQKVQLFQPVQKKADIVVNTFDFTAVLRHVFLQVFLGHSLWK